MVPKVITNGFKFDNISNNFQLLNTNINFKNVNETNGLNEDIELSKIIKNTNIVENIYNKNDDTNKRIQNEGERNHAYDDSYEIEVEICDGSNRNLNRDDNNNEGEDDEPLIAPSSISINESKIPLNERWYVIAFQVFVPYIVAGYGMVGAGIVLDKVQHWKLFEEVKEIYVLVPALLGLKGNLEMTLASRFSTQANLGQLNTRKAIAQGIIGNFLLTQGQAIIVGFLASVAAITLSVIRNQHFSLTSFLILTSGSISTASLASFLLAGLMMLVILFSRRFRINPDNIATPLAASLGDLVTLLILSTICAFLYEIKANYWIHILIIVLFLLITPLFIYFANKNDYVRDALHHGWVPIIVSMCISSLGGVILRFAVDLYKGIAVFQPVINGVGGNLAAIFASRLSTALHRTSIMGTKSYWAPQSFLNVPFDTFFGKKNLESKAARVLLLISLPGHAIFLITISKIEAGHIEINAQFIAFYLIAAILQIQILLFVCYWFVHFVWKHNRDPDNVCIPYLTALGDFLGTAFLAIAFHVLFIMGFKSLRSV